MCKFVQLNITMWQGQLIQASGQSSGPPNNAVKVLCEEFSIQAMLAAALHKTEYEPQFSTRFLHHIRC